MQRRTLLFVAAVLLLAVAGYVGAHLLLPKGPAYRVVIRVDGNVLYDVPLDKNADIPVRSQWGYNHIIIRDGSVWVSEADCPDQICLHQGQMNAANIDSRAMGNTIVCLPHRLSISLLVP